MQQRQPLVCGNITLNVTLVVADASTFSAVHSDVSYAAPDSGYTWSEMDTPEITGKSRQHNMTVWCVLPPLIVAGYYTLISVNVAWANMACFVCEVSADHVCFETAPSVSTCSVSHRMLSLHAICLPHERFLWRKKEKRAGLLFVHVRERDNVSDNSAPSRCFHWSGIGWGEYETNHNHGNVCFSLWSSLREY